MNENDYKDRDRNFREMTNNTVHVCTISGKLCLQVHLYVTIVYLECAFINVAAV